MKTKLDRKQQIKYWND